MIYFFVLQTMKQKQTYIYGQIDQKTYIDTKKSKKKTFGDSKLRT
jgi:hypothetical protein